MIKFLLYHTGVRRLADYHGKFHLTKNNKKYTDESKIIVPYTDSLLRHYCLL